MHTAFWISIMALGFGCTHMDGVVCATALRPPEVKSEGARLSREEALRIAKDELARQKVNTDKYNEPTAIFSRKDKEWCVSFDGKDPMPGNHCPVSIDDNTGKANFI